MFLNEAYEVTSVTEINENQVMDQLYIEALEIQNEAMLVEHTVLSEAQALKGSKLTFDEAKEATEEPSKSFGEKMKGVWEKIVALIKGLVAKVSQFVAEKLGTRIKYVTENEAKLVALKGDKKAKETTVSVNKKLINFKPESRSVKSAVKALKAGKAKDGLAEKVADESAFKKAQDAGNRDETVAGCIKDAVSAIKDLDTSSKGLSASVKEGLAAVEAAKGKDSKGPEAARNIVAAIKFVQSAISTCSNEAWKVVSAAKSLIGGGSED